MKYIKHPEFGNKHVTAEEAAKLVSAGWVIWPRSKEEKAGLARPAVPQQIAVDAADHTVASVRAHLDALGIPYDNRLGLGKLLALLPAV